MNEINPIHAIYHGSGWEVINGDCFEVLKLDGLQSTPADHVITDPPYDQRTSEGARSSVGSGRFIGFDGIDGQEAKVGDLCLSRSKRWTIIFCALEQLGSYQVVAGKDRWIRAGVWMRTTSMPQLSGDRPGQGSEGIAIMHQTGKKIWNGGGAPAGWSGPGGNSVGQVDARESGHPTQKPLWLMMDLIKKFTDPGDLVLDPFCGSGTTGVACLRLGRRFLGVEINAEYAKVAAERLEAESKGISLKAARTGQAALFGAK